MSEMFTCRTQSTGSNLITELEGQRGRHRHTNCVMIFKLLDLKKDKGENVLRILQIITFFLISEETK